MYAVLFWLQTCRNVAVGPLGTCWVREELWSGDVQADSPVEVAIYWHVLSEMCQKSKWNTQCYSLYGAGYNDEL